MNTAAKADIWTFLREFAVPAIQKNEEPYLCAVGLPTSVSIPSCPFSLLGTKEESQQGDYYQILAINWTEITSGSWINATELKFTGVY